MIRVRRAAALTVAALVTASAAGAQESAPRVYLSGDGIYQALYDPFTRDTTFELFHETGRYRAVYEVAKPPALSGGVGVRLWNVIGIGASMTRVQSQSSATIEGDVPHPFFFDRDRRVEGRVDGIQREERGIHLQFRLIMPLHRRLDLTLFGGPSRWRIDQDRVTEISYTSEYPFDTAQFTGVGLQRFSASRWGYNAGLDVGLYLTRHIGAGALIQLATANPDHSTAEATTADTRIGGLRAGGGLRLRF